MWKKLPDFEVPFQICEEEKNRKNTQKMHPPHVSLKASFPGGTELCVAVPVEKLPGLSTPGGCHLGTPGGHHLGTPGGHHLAAPSLLHLDTPTCRAGSHSDPIWSFCSYCFYSKTLVCASPSGCSCPGPTPSCRRPRSTLCALRLAASRWSDLPC